jgi:hypothetical protein
MTKKSKFFSQENFYVKKQTSGTDVMIFYNFFAEKFG